MVWFAQDKMKPLKYSYVCWIDVMGTASALSRSLSQAANFIMKLHIVALDSKQNSQLNVRLYPLVDGIYIVSDDQKDMLGFIKNVMTTLGDSFISEKKPLHRFMVRSAIAYGPVFSGEDTLECNNTLKSHLEYTKGVLFGAPLTEAYKSERNAPAFGVYLHESVRAFAPADTETLKGVYWQWWTFRTTSADLDLVKNLEVKLKEHFAWCKKYSEMISYPENRVDDHQKIAQQYFTFDRN